MTVEACVHHWILGDSVGGRVEGRCSKCGADRSFGGAWDDSYSWQYPTANPEGRLSRGRKAPPDLFPE